MWSLHEFKDFGAPAPYALIFFLSERAKPLSYPINWYLPVCHGILNFSRACEMIFQEEKKDAASYPASCGVDSSRICVKTRSSSKAISTVHARKGFDPVLTVLAESPWQLCVGPIEDSILGCDQWRLKDLYGPPRILNLTPIQCS